MAVVTGENCTLKKRMLLRLQNLVKSRKAAAQSKGPFGPMFCLPQVAASDVWGRAGQGKYEQCFPQFSLDPQPFTGFPEPFKICVF